ncbi:hypothetical protein BC938DRAFT_483892 [Jimgerdemannia flammicorona]|uniref:Uncharacterized protein n=1 Tax=Jimgerdemannia flammicorona TaxID=994334 RepID=A0A433QAX5_9FUNG|nr:hypothetical protein BC938DRAFT_483892 [Jimgerdemannia flammicorona]
MLVFLNYKSDFTFIRINNIIRRCPQLHHVILSVCNIDNKGASILAEVLKMNTSLQKLNLKDNDVGEKGASALAEALKMNENIETLDLEDNSIGAKGASTLAEALKMNTILQNLVLRRRMYE